MVLIVEDETLIALDLEAAVQGFGFRTSPVASGYASAAAVAERWEPDIALIDGRLANGPTGRPIAEHLHARGIFCIALTANPEVFEGCECIEIFLAKPYDEKKLERVLMQAEVALTIHGSPRDQGSQPTGS